MPPQEATLKNIRWTFDFQNTLEGEHFRKWNFAVDKMIFGSEKLNGPKRF